MDSLELGLLAIRLPDDRAVLSRRRQELLIAKERQSEVLSWIAEKNLRQSEIAKAIGVRGVNEVFTGRVQLPKAWIKPLSRLLDKTPEELLRAWRPWTRKRRPNPLLTDQDKKVRHLLAKHLDEHRLHQKKAARILGVRPQDLSMALNSLRRIPTSWYPAIADLLGIPLRELQPPSTSVGTPQPPKPYQPHLTCREEEARHRLSRLMKQHNLRQVNLAQLLGASQAGISRVHNAKKVIPDTWLPRIAEHLGISVDSLG
jgi:predicted XRE-type DNA-binding protein